MAGPTAFDASAIISGVISTDRLPPDFGGLPSFINVKDRGAKGDGETDDTAAIQAAIDSMSDGETLFFPPGTYIISEAASKYCLLIMDSFRTLQFTSASILKLASSSGTTPRMIQIGDSATPLSHVNIIGGVLDGNAANNTPHGILHKAITILGRVTDCNLVNVEIKDNLNGGVQIQGQDTSNRAQRIRAIGLHIHDVAEGFEFINADEVQFLSGRIWGMTQQDCFEPARGTLNWVLKDSVIGNSHTSNAPVEIFPGNGGDTTGVIENCYIPGQIRLSVGSGTASTDGSCKHIVIRNNNMTGGGNIVANIGGKVGTVIIENNILEGPPSSGTIYRHDGMELSGDQIIVRNNSVSGMRRRGIWVKSANAIIEGNRVFNNGADTGVSSSARVGISAVGANARIRGNHCFDSQVDATQTYGLIVNSTDPIIEDNIFSGNRSGDILTTGATGAIVGVNAGITPTRKSLLVTISAGSAYKRIPIADLPTSDTRARTRTVAQPLGPIAPASYWYIARRVSSALDIVLDQAVAADTEFIVWIDNSGIFNPVTLP